MAPLPKVCWDANEIRLMLAQNRDRDAQALLVKLLRSGRASASVQAIAAEIIAAAKPFKGKVGRPKGDPFRWNEIGARYEHLCQTEGLKSDDAKERLAEEFGRSLDTIKTTLTFYNRVREESRQIAADG